jgi:hypothetical protein
MLSDLVMMIHFLWIAFMILGFVLTVWHCFRAYVLKRSTVQADRFFDRWIFRSLHLAGIGFVMTLMLVGQYCPLTVLENYFRAGYDPQAVYPGSFIIHHLERLIYPDVSPLVLIVPTLIIAVFSVMVYTLRPPQKVRSLLKSTFRGP